MSGFVLLIFLILLVGCKTEEEKQRDAELKKDLEELGQLLFQAPAVITYGEIQLWEETHPIEEWPPETVDSMKVVFRIYLRAFIDGEYEKDQGGYIAKYRKLYENMELVEEALGHDAEDHLKGVRIWGDIMEAEMRE